MFHHHSIELDGTANRFKCSKLDIDGVAVSIGTLRRISTEIQFPKFDLVRQTRMADFLPNETC